jgi:hypothetical protein
VIEDAAAQALSLVASVRDEPRRRLELAARFYDDRPGRPSVHSYRRAELAFMRWQATRGVLAPMEGERPGSRWWRAVNEGLLRDAWEADRLIDGAPGTASRPAVTRWLTFLDHPTPLSWYRAHNASIVAGYLEHRTLSQAELPVERFFMDVALGRVVFVHCLLADPRVALGRWVWRLGRLIGDPRWRGADLYLSLRNVLPENYPLLDITITDVLEGENLLGRVLDYGILLPRTQAMYELAAHDLDEPGLLGFVADGNLVYAWPYEERHAWVTAKSRALTALVARITASPSPRGGRPTAGG